jgi:putative protein-disulfide isomerase
MRASRLHVIYDPFCGWCYGAAPLVEAARAVEGLLISLHGGGMMAGNSRQQMTPQLCDFILPHIERIVAVSGQPFGDGYRAMLNDTSVWLDSTPPTMAVVAAGKFGAEGFTEEKHGDKIANRELDMLDRLQRAHFLEGRRIAESKVLVDIAEELGIPRSDFAAGLATEMQKAGDHIRESRALLQRVGGAGFPTFALETQGNYEMLDSAQYLGKPGAWREMLEKAA